MQIVCPCTKSDMMFGIVTARQLSKMWPQIVLLLITSIANGDEQCSWGKYGENCDKICPLTCNTHPVRNLRHCQKYTGKCSEGCVPGHHGDQCNISCSRGCLNKTCNQGNGHCTLGCNGTYIGDYCNITSASIANGDEQCSWGKYGENCDKICPLTCNTHPVRNLRHCQKYTGKCSEGCVPGHHGDQCDLPCSRGCLNKTCNQGNGHCTLGCNGTYIGDYCNITSDTSPTTPSESRTETTPDLAVILVPVFLILVVVIAVVVIILWKRSRWTPAANRAGEDEHLTAELPEQVFATSDGGDVSPGSVVLQDDVNLLPDLPNIHKDISETESFKNVKEKMETLGHVIITGAPGEGKTTMAQMLGAEYRKQGYELLLVENVGKLRFSDYLDRGKNVCVILDDVFKTIRSYMDLSRLQNFLYELHVHLEQCEFRPERRYQRLQQDPTREHGKLSQPDICVIFTAETNNRECAMSNIKLQRFFKSSSNVKLSLTHQEKKSLWLKYRKKYDCSTEVDVNKIMAYEEASVGFSLVCKLFSSCVDFQRYNDSFFEKPLFYIQNQLRMVLSLLDDKSAALILMVLCEGQLNFSQLENEGASQDLEAHLQAVTTLVKTSTRQGVAEAVRSFCGTLLTEGNKTTFSHAIIYDVCAYVLFNVEPEFTLKHCSIKFLFEHVQDQQAGVIPVNEHQLIIQFSGAYYGILADRMADSLLSGALSEYIMYPILKRKEIADKVSLMIKDPTALSFDTKHNILHYACFTGNKNILERLLPHCDINRRWLNGWTPVMCAVVSGNMDCFDILVRNKADVTLCDGNNNNVLHLACQHGDMLTVKHVQRELKKLHSDMNLNGRGTHGWTPVMYAVVSGKKGVSDYLITKKRLDLTLRDRNNNTVFHLACLYGNMSTVKSLIPHTDINTRGHNGQTPVMCAVLFERKETLDLLVSNKADITLTDNDKNSLLHVACRVNDVSLFLRIEKHFHINSRGKHGWTPLMVAAVNGIFEVFHLLLKTGADLRLTDDNNNNLLHLACHGGNVSIVKILLPKFDINSRGKNGWTAVMFAAMNGVKEVFDLLVEEGANFTLRDVFNNSAFHLACTGGNISIVKYLLTRTDIDCRGHHGRTAIMMTALLATPKLFKVLFSGKEDYFEMRVIQEADFTLTDDYKDNVLHLACQGGSTDIVRYLWEKFDINIRGRDDQTPLMRAVCGGHMDVYTFLVSCGADQTLVDKDGHTLLHLATQHGQLPMVKYIIDSFDINAKDTAGLTPVMTSAVYNKVTVFECLRRRGADLSLVDNAGKDVLGLARGAGSRQIIEQLEHLEPARTAKP